MLSKLISYRIVARVVSYNGLMIKLIIIFSMNEFVLSTKSFEKQIQICGVYKMTVHFYVTNSLLKFQQSRKTFDNK